MTARCTTVTAPGRVDQHGAPLPYFTSQGAGLDANGDPLKFPISDCELLSATQTQLDYLLDQLVYGPFDAGQVILAYLYACVHVRVCVRVSVCACESLQLHLRTRPCTAISFTTTTRTRTDIQA